MTSAVIRKQSTNMADWVILAARWIFLLAASVWSIQSGVQNWLVVILLILTCASFLATMFTLVERKASQRLRLVFTLFDFLIAQIWLFVSLSFGRDFIWFDILPVVSASLSYQWIGGLIVILLNTLIQGTMGFQGMPLDYVLIRIGVMLPVSILLGLGLAYFSLRMQSRKDNLGITSSPNENSADRKANQGKRQKLYAMISELSATLNHQKALETSLNLASTIMAEFGESVSEFTSAVVLFEGEESEHPILRIAACRHFNIEDTSVEFPGTRGALASVIEEGTALLVGDPMLDPELSRIKALQFCRVALILPLRMGLDTYGVLLFAHPNKDCFTDERWEALEILRNQTSIAIQNSLLFQQLELERNRLLEIQDESRRKLARDLHDGPTQSISAIAMRVNYARRLMDRDLKTSAEELYKIEDLARKTTKEIRHMLFTLRPLVLESQGLEAALESMSEKMNETYGQNVSVNADKHLVEQLETAKQAVVFFIAEEAVNNARKHAQAEHIWVRLKMVGDGLGFLEIEDDGKGFDVAAVDANYSNRGSLGLINLRERAEHINGLFKIDSTLGLGTRVGVMFPLTEDAADRLRKGV
jgi:signal transduction histidine kinase